MATAANRTHSGEGPSRAGVSERPDLISNQPDAVLETIVSLLPIKDGCRTQALSRRWRPIWRSAPLILHATRCSGGLSLRTISNILAGHLGPVRRISTALAQLPSRYDRRTGCRIVDDKARDARTRFEAQFSSPYVLNGLQAVLDLDYSYDVVPPFVFHGVNFPILEKLSLYKVSLTEETLTVVLAGCPALRSLLLEKTVGSDRLRINSQALRSIGFCAPYDRQQDYYCGIVKVQELIIEDAPRLERLLPLNTEYGPATIRVVRAPKLEVLGCLSRGTSQLHLGTTVFQEMIATSLTTTMPTVKVLALDHVGPNLDAVLDFLKCFPCLESLYIIIQRSTYPSPYFENELCPPENTKFVRKYSLTDDPIECLRFHLRKVALKVYYGTRVEVDFARFFVLNARVLERMEFGVVDNPKDKWRDKQIMQLQLESRSSRNALFEFKKFTLTTFKNNSKRVHDLSMADPFKDTFLEGFVTHWQV